MGGRCFLSCVLLLLQICLCLMRETTLCLFLISKLILLKYLLDIIEVFTSIYLQ